MSHNVVTFLLNLFEACSPQVACKLRTNPTIFKRISSIYAQLLPTLTSLEDTRLQSCIYIVKTHCAKVDILDYQTPAGNKVAAHVCKCRYWFGEVLTDICTKNEIYTTIGYRQLLQQTMLVLDYPLISFTVHTPVCGYQCLGGNINSKYLSLVANGAS